MAAAINTTVRGKFVTHRSAYWKRPIAYPDSATQSAVEGGVYQGGCFGTDDAGNASLVAFISQRLFQFLIQGNTPRCQEIIIPGGPILPIQPQAWLWQSERWIIIQDGKNNPLFLDLDGGVTPVYGTPNFGTVTRSNNAVTTNYTTKTLSNFSLTNAPPGIPPVGQQNTIQLQHTTNLIFGDVVTIQGIGQFQVQLVASDGITVTLLNLNGVNAGGNVAAGVTLSWSHVGLQMPPGRMGAYIMGRNWFSLPNGLQFIAGDIVDGSSGTQPFAFRDAVLYVKENTYITGGGTFSIPGSAGETIQAIVEIAILDASLGQGPVQILTNYRVFSCNAPANRLTWQTLTYPILTVNLICNGAEGQYSTISRNSDILFRSVDGVRSLTMASLDFLTWRNTPISFEVSPILQQDNLALLQYGSAVVFDNRLLMTTGPAQFTQGVAFNGLVVVNFDEASTLRQKSDPVWDSGVWTGMNVLQLMIGEVAGVQRAFAFNLNPARAAVEIWEILPSTGPLSATTDYDGNTLVPITWQFDSASLRFGVPKTDHIPMFLSNGELWIDEQVGQVNFAVQYWADQYPAPTLWRAWSSPALSGNPGFAPRQGLGEPSPAACDPSGNRPLRNGFTFQTRTTIVGHCTIVGEFYEAQTVPQPKFAPITGCPVPVAQVIAQILANPPTGGSSQTFPGGGGGTGGYPQQVFGVNAGGYPNLPTFTPPGVTVAVNCDPTDGNISWFYNGTWH